MGDAVKKHLEKKLAAEVEYQNARAEAARARWDAANHERNQFFITNVLERATPDPWGCCGSREAHERWFKEMFDARP